ALAYHRMGVVTPLELVEERLDLRGRPAMERARERGEPAGDAGAERGSRRGDDADSESRGVELVLGGEDEGGADDPGGARVEPTSRGEHLVDRRCARRRSGDGRRSGAQQGGGGRP